MHGKEGGVCHITCEDCFTPSVFFVTLTAAWDSSTLEAERTLFKAFRRFLKIAASDGLSYIWKCEKTSPEHQHFHLVCEGLEVWQMRRIWALACSHFNIRVFDYSSDFQLVTMTTEDFKRISRYMAKQTEFAVDGKLFSMSNSMQNHKPKLIRRNSVLVGEMTNGMTPQYSNDFCSVFDRLDELPF